MGGHGSRHDESKASAARSIPNERLSFELSSCCLYQPTSDVFLRCVVDLGGRVVVVIVSFIEPAAIGEVLNYGALPSLASSPGTTSKELPMARLGSTYRWSVAASMPLTVNHAFTK